MKRQLSDGVKNQVTPLANRRERRLLKRLDQKIPLREAVRLLPPNSNGKFIHRSVLFRYAKDGKRGIILQTWLVPPVGLCTTPRAVKEFITALTATLHRPSAPKVDGHADAEAANKRLLNGVFSRSRKEDGK